MACSVSSPNRSIKDSLMSFNKKIVLFVHFSLFEYTKFKNVFYYLHFTLQNAKYYVKYFKIEEKVLRLNMTCESRTFSFTAKIHITKHLLTSISVDIRIYLPEKMTFNETARQGLGEYHFFG